MGDTVLEVSPFTHTVGKTRTERTKDESRSVKWRLTCTKPVFSFQKMHIF